MNRFSKDVDTLDNLLAGSFALPRHVTCSNPIIPDSFRMFLATLANIIGAIVFVSIILPWFLIAVAVVSVFYIMAAAFYRASAREMKVRTSQNILLLSIYRQGTPSVWKPSCDHRYIPISLSPYQGLRQFVLIMRKVDSSKKIETGWTMRIELIG